MKARAERRFGRDVRRGAGSPERRPIARFANHALCFALGAVLASAAFLIYSQVAESGHADLGGSGNRRSAQGGGVGGGCRTVAQLVALSDAELEQVDLVEMNVAVARGIPGLEKLDYGKYRRIVDGWTDEFLLWLPTAENAFRREPAKYRNDVNFFRLGMLAQFLDQSLGIRYVEEQKQAQLDARKAGRKAEVAYTDPGHLLLHGLIDTKRGTCATMPALHAAIARRLGWPVALACADSHYVCRYDDGKVMYNIEATDTGRGGFAAGTDRDYVEKEGVSPRAVAVGSDLRKLTAREMLGVFVGARARHFSDTDRTGPAARDYALAHTLFPNNRKVYIGLVANLLPVGERLFAGNEHGHPASLAAYLAGRYDREASMGLAGAGSRGGGKAGGYPDPIAEAERINELNRANMERATPRPPGQAQPPTGPPVPGGPGPPQPNYPRSNQPPVQGAPQPPQQP